MTDGLTRATYGGQATIANSSGGLMSDYECNICGETEYHLHGDPWVYELAICTDCWFKELLGRERKAIAKRVSA